MNHISIQLFLAFVGMAVLVVTDDLHAAERESLAIAIDVSSPAAAFTPDGAFGAGVDGLEKRDAGDVYTPENIKAMAGAAHRRLAYRLRTELAIEAWHWNDSGSWSDEANRQGYWTSGDKADQPLLKSFGYRLPRRGNTFDQAGNDGYSRLDDGDESAFWKSNPYLDAHFTSEDNALHPQWIFVDLGARRQVDALRVLWGEPYATRFEVQYWDGKSARYLNDLKKGAWRAFPRGRVEDGKGDDATLRLAEAPVSVRYVRILLSASSGGEERAENGRAADARDRLGYAVRELYIGALDGQGRLRDVIRHGASNASQTRIIVSSTDPWHRAGDLNPNSEHPGFDRILESGLGKGNPILIPAAVLYDTPDNAAAEMRFLRSRGFPMTQVELGEEPDGQNASPEHYGALYLQFARAIHGVDPALVTGGPGFQSEIEGWNAFADASGERSWMKRFIAYLRARGRLDDFGFFSFEWYPFDDMCEAPGEQLIEQPALMSHAFERLWKEGVPKTIPWIITEYGYSSFAGRAEVELPAALLNAEIVAQFLTLGGRTAYLYGLEPNMPIRELEGCARHPDRLWGNLMMFQAGPGGVGGVKLLPAYHSARMLAEEWAQPGAGAHHLFRTSVMEGAETPDDVTAYAVRRPDGRWALLALNKSADRIEAARIRFVGGKEGKDLGGRSGGEGADWTGPLDVIQYSARQYEWTANGADGHPKHSDPPVLLRFPEGLASRIELPPMSVTVIRSQHPFVGRTPN
jgi:hypothetical protein